VTLLGLVTNLTLFAGVGLAIGAVAARWWIVPDSRPELRVPAARIGLVGAGLVLSALVLVLTRQLLEFRDPFSTWSDDAGLLLGTNWGSVWKVGLVAAAALVLAFAAAARGSTPGWVVATAAAVGLGVFPALTGHASGGDLRIVTIPADAVHVWAMGAWMGGLAVVLLLERRVVRSSGDESVLPYLIPRFSPLAMVSVGALVLSGLVGSWIHVGRVAAIVDTTYGRWLALKVTVAGVVLLLGAVNFKRLLPRLGDPGGPEAMRRSAALEVAVAVLVLVVTAVLVRTSPG
jgi:copper transport protein